MTTAAHRKEPAPPGVSVTAVVGLLVLFELVSGFLQAGIAPVLPSIGDEWGVSDSALTWVIAVQLLSAAVSLPAFGRLGDLYGHRRMLRIALVSVAVGSVLVAFAPSFAVLLAGRFLQGPLAALLPLEISLVRDRLPVDLARSAIARLVGALTLGGLLGGLGMGIADKAFGDVRLALGVPAVLTLVCVAVSFVAIPESARRATGRVDWPGVALLGLAVVAVLAGVSGAGDNGWLSGTTLVPVLAGLALLAAWAVVELRTAEPLVDLRAMAGRHVAPYYFASFAFGVIYFGSQSPNSTFFATDPDEAGYGFGLSSLSIALAMLPAMLVSVVASASTAVVARRVGYRNALIGSFLLVAAGFAAFAAAHDVLWLVVAELTVLAAGMGVALGAMPTVIAEASDPSRTGVATAVYNNVKTVGGAVAGGMFGTLLAAPAGSDDPAERGYLAVWLVGAGFALLAAVLALAARGRSAD
ncbi:Major Facilitator Superfamily protein [Actinomadura meyerae]|uniref:Major Facilitator Superfamily protein n=1 Tax=Actinomadura meyerae TaxID=240840 RepID=A0A239NX87_9ACTN|nr:MFS transporter [Actinomadura meyerae]SNT59360.1 Major Facilitator Superfamily protein [Actinomadura meyerae]